MNKTCEAITREQIEAVLAAGELPCQASLVREKGILYLRIEFSSVDDAFRFQNLCPGTQTIKALCALALKEMEK